jgi:DNA-binding Xre family transcriptional regulator
MIRFTLGEMLEKKGLTAYGLHKASFGKVIEKGKEKEKHRLHQSVISKIKNNKSKALQLDILSVLCELLDCQPADLMIYESTTQIVSTTQNVERATQSTKHTQNVNTTQSVSNSEIWLSTNKVAERLKVSRKSINDYILDGKLPATKGEHIPNHKGNRTHNFIKLDDVLIYESVYTSKG